MRWKPSIWALSLAITATLPLFQAVASAQEVELASGGRVPVVLPGEVPATQLLKTNDMEFTPKGTVRVGMSADWLRGVSMPYSGLAGDLWQLGVLRLDVGFSDRIEVQVRGIVRQELRIDESRSAPSPGVPKSGRTHDVGDFTVTTLARVMNERGLRPAVGIRVEAKLPNTDEARGIGTNTTDVVLTVLLQTRLERFTIFSDLGLGILTEPTVLRSQNDVLVYGFASKYEVSHHVTLMAELNGRWAPSGFLPGTEDHSQLRGGLAWRQGGLTCEFLLTHGFTRFDESVGAAFGLSFGFPVFRRVTPG